MCGRSGTARRAGAPGPAVFWAAAAGEGGEAGGEARGRVVSWRTNVQRSTPPPRFLAFPGVSWALVLTRRDGRFSYAVLVMVSIYTAFGAWNQYASSPRLRSHSNGSVLSHAVNTCEPTAAVGILHGDSP